MYYMMKEIGTSAAVLVVDPLASAVEVEWNSHWELITELGVETNGHWELIIEPTTKKRSLKGIRGGILNLEITRRCCLLLHALFQAGCLFACDQSYSNWAEVRASCS